MLISFLNGILPEEKKSGYITSVSYLPAEHFGEMEDERRVIFDARCKTDEGEDIIVEMQNAQPWHYALKAIYVVAIVNFPMLENSIPEDTVIDWIQLMSVKTKQRFSDKLNFVIVDLTKFNKKKEELKMLRDYYWLYTLKHAETLRECPEEMKTYNSSVMELKNLSLFTDYAKMEGIEIGEKRGERRGVKIGEQRGEQKTQARYVLKLFQKGMSVEEIADLTELSVEEVNRFLK
jgi:predicted transposase/invertase (TIGR01784 family)